MIYYMFSLSIFKNNSEVYLRNSTDGINFSLINRHLHDTMTQSKRCILPTRNNGIYKTDNLTCQSQVFRSNRLQTRNLQYYIKSVKSYKDEIKQKK